MTAIAAASFFSNICRFGGCGVSCDSLAELIGHIEDHHIDTDPRLLERQEQQQPTYVALSYVNRFMTEAARREPQTVRKKSQPKLSLSLSSAGEGLARSLHTPTPWPASGSLTPPVTPPITPSSSFHSSTPTGSECDEEEVDYEDSDSNESWTMESAISSESILGSMGMNGGDEKPFACPVPGCNKRYKNVNGIKYHAKNGHRNQIRARKPFKCRCGKSYKTSQGLRNHTITLHPQLTSSARCSSEVEKVEPATTCHFPSPVTQTADHQPTQATNSLSLSGLGYAYLLGETLVTRSLQDG